MTDLRPQTRSVAGMWDELLTSRELLDETFAGEAGFGPAQLDQVHAWCVRQARVRSEADRDGEAPTLDAEDAALLLAMLAGAPRARWSTPEAKPIRFAHVFVDEVQDASPIELRVLLELTGKDRCITLAGDVAQRMLDDGDDRGEFDWNALLDGLGVPHTRIEPLKVSYRSTAEITRFARAILGPLSHEDVPVTTRSGPPVELFGFASPGEAVAWLAESLKQLARDEPDANVALVARFPQQADVYFEGLSRAEVPNVRRVAKQDFSWEPGVDVTDVRQTKGLEFDEVVLLETTTASYPVTSQARHALYVGRDARLASTLVRDQPGSVGARHRRAGSSRGAVAVRRAWARRAARAAWACFGAVLATMAAEACHKEPIVTVRPVSLHAPRSCAAGVPSLDAKAYGVFHPFGDFEPPSSATGHVLGDVGATLPELDPAVRALVVDVTESDRPWQGEADVAATGPVDLLLLPTLTSCALSRTRDAGARAGVALAPVGGRRVLLVGGDGSTAPGPS